MNELATIIARLSEIAAMEDIEMRTELGFYVRELEKQFEKNEYDLEREFDNYPI